MIDAVTCGKWEPDSFDLTKSQKFVVRMALSILIYLGSSSSCSSRLEQREKILWTKMRMTGEEGWSLGSVSDV